MAFPYHPFSSLLLIFRSPPRKRLFPDYEETFSSRKDKQLRQRLASRNSQPRLRAFGGLSTRAVARGSAVENVSPLFFAPFSSTPQPSPCLYYSPSVLTLPLSATKRVFSTYSSKFIRTSSCRQFYSDFTLSSYSQPR